MNFLMKIGNKIKEMRVEQSLGQEELANSVSISPTSLRQIEKGRQNLTIEMLRKLVEDGLHSDLAAFFAQLEQGDNVTEDASEEKLWSLYEKQVRQSMYPPHLSHYKISSLLEFLIYLPLIEPSMLVDLLGRVQGNVIGKEDYIIGKINYVVGQITDSPAKQFADLEVQAMSVYARGQESQPLRDEEIELYNAYIAKIENLERFMRHAELLLSVVAEMKADQQINISSTSSS